MQEPAGAALVEVFLAGIIRVHQSKTVEKVAARLPAQVLRPVVALEIVLGKTVLVPLPVLQAKLLRQLARWNEVRVRAEFHA